MPEFLTPATFDNIGVVAVICVVGYFFLRSLTKGTLRTEREVIGIETDRDYWRNAFFTEQSAHSATIKQNTELLEIGRLQQYTIEAGMREGESRGVSG